MFAMKLHQVAQRQYGNRFAADVVLYRFGDAFQAGNDSPSGLKVYNGGAEFARDRYLCWPIF